MAAPSDAPGLPIPAAIGTVPSGARDWWVALVEAGQQIAWWARGRSTPDGQYLSLRLLITLFDRSGGLQFRDILERHCRLTTARSDLSPQERRADLGFSKYRLGDTYPSGKAGLC